MGDHELFSSIEAGDVDRVRQLLGRDPSLASARNEAGLSAVLAARYRGQHEMVSALLDAGPDLDVFDAAAVGAVDRLTQLLDREPALANAYASDGFLPLGLAAFFGQPAAVQLLLQRGADVGATARNPMRVQALHAAVAGRNRDAVGLLLEAGADPNVHQHGGWTPLMAAAAHGDEEIVDLLLRRGADATAANDAGQDAVSLAVQNGHAELTRARQALTADTPPFAVRDRVPRSTGSPASTQSSLPPA